MNDKFILKDHLKVYFRGPGGIYDPWQVMSNYNVTSVDIDRFITDQTSFAVVNSPGTATIRLRRNIITGTKIDGNFEENYFDVFQYTHIKVVATVYPDTNPTDINVFWGVVERMETVYYPSPEEDEVTHYDVTLYCSDMLSMWNNLNGETSFVAGYPEDRFVQIAASAFLYTGIAGDVAYSGVTLMPAETGLVASVGEQLREIQESDLAFVSCDYYNELIRLYGRYYLPTLSPDYDTLQTADPTVGFSTVHSNDLNHFCPTNIVLAKTLPDTGTSFRLYKKSNPAVAVGPIAGKQIPINCTNLTELVALDNQINEGTWYETLENVSASVIQRSNHQLIPELVALQPILNLARIYLERDGEIINKAYMVSKVRHTIDADSWTIDVGGVRTRISTWYDPEVEI